METFDTKQYNRDNLENVHLLQRKASCHQKNCAEKGFRRFWSKIFRTNLFVQSKHVMSFKISVSLHPATPAVLIVAITFLLPRWFLITMVSLWQSFLYVWSLCSASYSSKSIPAVALLWPRQYATPGWLYLLRKWSFSSNSERLLDWKTGLLKTCVANIFHHLTLLTKVNWSNHPPV